MKRALLWSLGITALIAGVVVAVISRIDAGFIIKQIAALTERATGQALVCENPPEISFFPPGLSLGKARWGEISKGQGMAATVKSGTLVLELFPLFSGNMVIKEIRLDNPVFEMRGNAPASPEGEKTGTASASQGQHAASPPPPTSPPPDYPADLPVELERLVLRQGEILWDDGSNKRGHAKNINLSVENLRRREEAAVQCDFTFDVMQGKTDVLSGTLALDAKLRYEAATLIFRQSSVTFTPLKGRIPKDAGPVQLACEGSFALAKENLRLQTLRLTLPYNVKIQAELDLLVGKNLSVKGKVQSSVIPADKYAALLKKMDSLPAEDAKAAPARTAAPSAAGKKHPSGEKTSWPLVDMRISAAGVHYGKLGLNDIAVEAKGANGKYALTSISCSLASGGVFKGGADIDIPDKFHGLKITARGVNIGGLLEALNKGRPAEGTADLDADINTRGESAKEFTASLNGTGLLEARDVRAAALASLSKTIPGLSLESFQLIRVPFAVRNGEVTAQPVTAVSRDIEIKGRAQAALPREHLDATATVHALGMNIPVFAKGPFNNLSYGLDAKFALPGLQQTSGTLSKTGKAAGGEVKKGTQKAKGLVKGLFGR